MEPLNATRPIHLTSRKVIELIIEERFIEKVDWIEFNRPPRVVLVDVYMYVQRELATIDNSPRWDDKFSPSILFSILFIVTIEHYVL